MVVQQAEAILNSDPAIPSNTTFILIADPNPRTATSPPCRPATSPRRSTFRVAPP